MKTTHCEKLDFIVVFCGKRTWLFSLKKAKYSALLVSGVLKYPLHCSLTVWMTGVIMRSANPSPF